MRKGQITIFIILGLVVVLAAAFLWYTQRAPASDVTARAAVPPIALETYNQINDCFQTLAEDYITILGMEGGYLLIHLSPDEVRYPIRDWMTDAKENIPDFSLLEQDLGKLLTRTIPYCVGEYPVPGLRQLEAVGEPNVRTVFRENDVLVVIKYPIRATIQDVTVTLSDHVFTVPVRLRHVLNIAGAITSMAAAEPRAFSEDWLLGYDVDITVAPAPRYWTYVITDDRSRLKGEPFQFTFIHHYGDAK